LNISETARLGSRGPPIGNGHLIDDVTWPEGQTRDRDPNTIRAQYLENSCSAAIVCCEVVRAAILATARLLSMRSL